MAGADDAVLEAARQNKLVLSFWASLLSQVVTRLSYLNVGPVSSIESVRAWNDWRLNY